MNDESRRALRNLARQAEWRGRAGAAGAAQDARTLQDLGREIESVLAREEDRTDWSHAAADRLAAHCRRAQPDWSVDQISELSRLRDEAVIALAPAPGQTDDDPAQPTSSTRPSPRLPLPASLTSATTRRPALIALALVGCLVLAAVILLVPHFLGNDSADTPVASATSTAPAIPTTYAAPTTDAPTASPSTPASAPTSPGFTSPSTASPSASVTSASTSHVTAIQISPEPQQGYPEVIVSGTITASGTDDVTITLTVTGTSGQPQITQIDDSGQTSYNLTQTIYLNQWCGQKTVLLTVSSGSVSKSATVPVSGC